MFTGERLTERERERERGNLRENDRYAERESKFLHLTRL